jgi:hypothetical protein
MKKIYLLSASALLFFALAGTARALNVTGFVFCDANQNGVIDAGDVGIPGVTVVFTNLISNFTNSAVTAADGSFSAAIPPFDPLPERRDPLAQIYGEGLDTNTLPPGFTILIPTAITNLTDRPGYFFQYGTVEGTNFIFNSGLGTTTNGDWLIDSPFCHSNAACKLSGGGNISSSGKKPDHTFGGSISSTPPSGSWTDVAHALKLKFETTTIQTVTCGSGTMDVTGTGTLQGIGGNKANFDSVLFTLHVEDHGTPGKRVDTYYLRVYTADGTTLLLVSSDPGDPTVISPVPITHGNLSVQPQ